MRASTAAAGAASAAALAVALSGCTGESSSPPRPSGADASSADYVSPVGRVTEIATGLQSPWSMLPVDDGTLVSDRDSGEVVRVADDGSLSTIGTVPGVVHQGEGGLLGLALLEADSDGADGIRWLYAYLTTQDDNRIVRMPLDGSGVSLSVGEPEIVLDGLAKAGNHDGGRIAFGPDGDLYATVGDAGEPDRAQDPDSLNGKILRMEPDGSVPDDNPAEGSLVYSLGHRNPQGIAWDADGQLWAAEFGQDTWDEFNRIEPGGNYGWPIVEGVADDGDGSGTDSGDFIDPVAQWSTDVASPSGVAYVGNTFFLAGLGGERLWALYPADLAGGWGALSGGDAVSATPWFEGDDGYGRLRDVTAGPDGSLWMLTNNTDGRGDPRDGDDRILQVPLGELVEG